MFIVGHRRVGAQSPRSATSGPEVGYKREAGTPCSERKRFPLPPLAMIAEWKQRRPPNRGAFLLLPFYRVVCEFVEVGGELSGVGGSQGYL